MYNNIKKVDERGIKIKGSIKSWRTKHPNELYFDSLIEWKVWKHLLKNKIKFQLKPVIELIPSKQIVSLHKKKNIIVTTLQRNMKYTPDFLLTETNTYIEVKGWATEEFKLRWKLFKAGDRKGFIVHNLVELNTVLNYCQNESESQNKD